MLLSAVYARRLALGGQPFVRGSRLKQEQQRQQLAPTIRFLSNLTNRYLNHGSRHQFGRRELSVFRKLLLTRDRNPRSTGILSRSHSYWHGASNRPLIGCTTYDALRLAAEANGDRPAVVSCHQSIRKSYTEFIDDVDQLAGAFASLNYPIGTMVGIASTNVYEWVVTQFATAKIGWTLVNINFAFQAQELEYVLHLAKCKVLIIGDPTYNLSDHYGMLQKLVPGLDSMKPGNLRSERLPDLALIINLDSTCKGGCLPFAELLQSSTPALVRAANDINSKLDIDSFVNVQFTSGTTGNPKAVPLTHHNTVNNARTLGQWSGIADDRQAAVCLNVPLMHCFGCVIGSLNALMHGAHLVMPAPRFNGQAALDAMSKYRCTMVLGTPTMYIDMLSKLDASVHNLDSLHSGIMAGSPCLLALRERVIQQMGLDVLHVAYGATEMSPVVSFTTKELLKRRPESVGIAMDHTEIKIVDKEGRIVPFGERGELCSRGYHIFRGYLHQPDKTAEVVHNGWYHSGDEAVMSSDGIVAITGRVKDMIIRGGENIYPTEIENFLLRMPQVDEAHVCGVPDERMGEEVCVWLKLSKDAVVARAAGGSDSSGEAQQDDAVVVDEQRVRDFCKGNLAHFKIPRYIVFTDTFPKTLSGKIQKFKMREEMCRRLGINDNTF